MHVRKVRDGEDAIAGGRDAHPTDVELRAGLDERILDALSEEAVKLLPRAGAKEID